MIVVHPDFGRRIDLPGAGPCPRPVDMDRAGTGLATLVSLRVYSFAQGVAIDGEAEGDEVFIVLMRGRAGIVVSRNGREQGSFALDAEGGVRAVYMPPHAAYRLSATGDCDIAYARVEPSGAALPEVRGFAPAAGRLDVTGHATGMDLSLATLQAGEPVELAGIGRSPERFVHVRAAGEMAATIAGQPLRDWDSAALAEGESIAMTVESGAADILVIKATTSPNGRREDSIDRP